MAEQNMLRYPTPTMQQLQEEKRLENYRRQQYLIMQQQQQQQQQPSPPQHPLQLRNPTPYHQRQKEMETQQQQLGAAGGSSFNATIDPTLIAGQQFQLQLHQMQQQQQQLRQTQQQASIKQETGSPNFSGSDMEYDSQGNLLSPTAQSPMASPTNAQYEDLSYPNYPNQHGQYARPQQYQQQQSPSQPLQHPSDTSNYASSPQNGSGPYSPDTNGDAASDYLDGESYGVVSPHATSAQKGIPVPINIGINGAVAGSYGSHGTFGQSPSSLTGQPIAFGQSVPVQKSNWFGSLENSNGFPTAQSLTRYSTGELFGDGDEADTRQRNLQQLFEKRRKRRESHNAVERRRRDNINEKIHELSTLLPEYMDGPSSPSPAAASIGGGVGGNGQKPNKGAILRKSVDHIKNLQTEVVAYQRRVRELEEVIGNLQRNDPSLISALGIQVPSS